MGALDELYAELEADEATKALAAKVREAAAAELDTVKAQASTATKALKAAEAERNRLKSDLDASTADVDERVSKLQQERDAAAAKAAQLEAGIAQRDLRQAIADELGITDAKRRRRATDAFLADYGEGVELVEGKLQGHKEALGRFRKDESWFFGAASDEGHGGRLDGRPPAKPKPGGKLEGQAAIDAARKMFSASFKRKEA